MSSVGSLRQRNEYFLSEIFLIIFTLFYFIGWIYRKIEDIDLKGVKLISHIKSFSKKYSVLFMLFVIVVFAAGALQFGVKSTTTVSSTLSVITGEAKQFKTEMEERLNLYLDDEIKNVKVHEITSIPHVFMEDTLLIDWGNKAIVRYYDKNYVEIIKE